MSSPTRPLHSYRHPHRPPGYRFRRISYRKRSCSRFPHDPDVGPRQNVLTPAPFDETAITLTRRADEPGNDAGRSAPGERAVRALPDRARAARHASGTRIGDHTPNISVSSEQPFHRSWRGGTSVEGDKLLAKARQGTVHWDHNPRDPDHRAIQGLVALRDTGPGRGGFRCAPPLYRNRAAWPREPSPPYGWEAKVCDQDIVEVPAEAGDLLVWIRGFRTRTRGIAHRGRGSPFMCRCSRPMKGNERS
jgi:hypothetical protein